jgi:hypothetical protein
VSPCSRSTVKRRNVGRPVTWSYAARLSSRGWILVRWVNGQNHIPARLRQTLRRNPIPPTIDSGVVRDALLREPPMFMPSGVLAGSLMSHWAANRPVVRASAKQLMAFMRDDALVFERARLRRESPRVNGPRYPTEDVRGVELADVGCSLSMNKRRKHPSK